MLTLSRGQDVQGGDEIPAIEALGGTPAGAVAAAAAGSSTAGPKCSSDSLAAAVAVVGMAGWQCHR